MKVIGDTETISGIVGMLVILFFILSIVLKIISNSKDKEAMREIENRSPEYIRWVKCWAGSVKEEKEFKKSLTE